MTTTPPQLIERLHLASRDERMATGLLYREAAETLRHIRDFAQRQVALSPEEAALWASVVCMIDTGKTPGGTPITACGPQ